MRFATVLLLGCLFGQLLQASRHRGHMTPLRRHSVTSRGKQSHHVARCRDVPGCRVVRVPSEVTVLP